MLNMLWWWCITSPLITSVEHLSTGEIRSDPASRQISERVYGTAAQCFWLKMCLDTRTNPSYLILKCIACELVPPYLFNLNQFCWWELACRYA